MFIKEQRTFLDLGKSVVIRCVLLFSFVYRTDRHSYITIGVADL